MYYIYIVICITVSEISTGSPALHLFVRLVLLLFAYYACVRVSRLLASYYICWTIPFRAPVVE